MRCKHCGNRNERRASYCSECGRKLKVGHEPTFYRAFITLSLITFALVLAVGAGLIGIVVGKMVGGDIEAKATPEPESAPVASAYAEDVEPIAALIDFINTGDGSKAGLAFGEGFMRTLIKRESGMDFPMAEHAMYGLIRDKAIKKITEDIGDFDRLSFEFFSRRELVPDSEREITIELSLLPSGLTRRITLTVKCDDGRWYLSPKGLY